MDQTIKYFIKTKYNCIIIIKKRIYFKKITYLIKYLILLFLFFKLFTVTILTNPHLYNFVLAIRFVPIRFMIHRHRHLNFMDPAINVEKCQLIN